MLWSPSRSLYVPRGPELLPYLTPSEWEQGVRPWHKTAIAPEWRPGHAWCPGLDTQRRMHALGIVLPGYAAYRRDAQGLGSGGGGTPAWTPLSPGNLVLWLKSDTDTYQDSALTTTATADTNPVGGWKDQSGAGNHVLQATSGKRPLLKLTQVNSLPSVRFDGVDDYLNALFALDRPFDVFLVVNQITWTSGRMLVAGGANDKFDVDQNSSSPNLRIWNGTTVGGTNSDLNTATWALLEAGIPLGSGSYLKVNNSTATTGGSPQSSARGGITLAAHPNPSNYSNIELAEVIVYSAILGSSDQTALRAYCTARYGFP